MMDQPSAAHWLKLDSLRGTRSLRAPLVELPRRVAFESGPVPVSDARRRTEMLEARADLLREWRELGFRLYATRRVVDPVSHELTITDELKL
jgi:hypothetical protein